MGTYYTFFAATPVEVGKLFPGWSDDSPAGELAHPNLYDDVWGAAVPPIVAPTNEHARRLEEAAAPGLRALPHFRLKNADGTVDLKDIPKVISSASKTAEKAVLRLRQGLGGDDVPVVWAFPRETSQALSQIGDEDLDGIARTLVGEAVDNDNVRQMLLEPLRTLAQGAGPRGALVCYYFSLHF